MQLDKHLPSDSQKCDRLSPRKCIPVASRNCDRLIQLPRPFQMIRLSQQLTRTHSLITPL
ncbi:hypothetical protein [Limnospira platensis]|uniref:hypothetical protein n=1 Tax=Limnospira platensis TaxID=118562 RepID=UPI003D6DEBF2